MEFFIYSRAAGAADVDDEHERALDEQHWSYMDRFADGMVARGPTLDADRASWTGSIHIVDLPGAEAAHEFVEHEPYDRAGLFEEHLIRRFHNLLGRTMWEFPGASDEPRFMVIAEADAHAPAAPLIALPRERLIVHGELLTPEEGRTTGVALALQAPTRDAVVALLGLDQHPDARLLDWEFGGRR
jgi:uncharacterized protein YciI